LKTDNDFSSYKDYFLVGIGGAGMSAIALVLKGMGFSVRGSDIKDSRYTAMLQKEGLEVLIGHNKENIKGSDIVIYSTAIPADNQELTEARERGIPVYSRSDILSWIINMKKGIAIAGTHGKTTTTSMISMVFKDLGFDPTIVVGGELNELGSNAINGNSEYVVAEACESDGSFLKYTPFMGIVTNIEEDHFDHYTDMKELRESFMKFMSNIKKGGWLVVNGDETDPGDIPEGKDLNILTFGLAENNDIYASNIRFCGLGSEFQLNAGKKVIKVKLGVPGLHNIKNSLAAFAASSALGADLEKAASVLKAFTGVKRRFDKRGKKKGAVVFDDYAHHPSEVRATLEAAFNNKKKGRIVAVFQPHRYSRLVHLNDEFGGSFHKSDILILTDVYGAGEQPVPGVNGKMLVDSVIENDYKNKIAYIPRLSDIPEYIDSQLKAGDILLLMGAGDITRVTDELFKDKKDN
jgi:UDP-N-acetylmuramate--alanine ligase